MHCRPARFTPALLIGIALGLASCGGSGGSTTNAEAPPITVPLQRADIAVLFFGNSHTHAHNVPGLVGAMLEAGHPGKTVLVVDAPGVLFLDERVQDAASNALLDGRGWTHLVLQAQRYSSSGTVNYPTVQAEDWVRRARAKAVTPVMYPEWPRAGIQETDRIWALYGGIAQRAGACIAPVPMAFDRAKATHPDLELHAADGNHSSAQGALLAAYILYATLSGRSPTDLPTLGVSAVHESAQARLRQLAASSLAAGPAAQAGCPSQGMP